MVLINQSLSSLAPAPHTLQLESGRKIHYVAPRHAKTQPEIEENIHRRKSNSQDRMEEIDGWEGVRNLCSTLDSIVEMEMETDLFDGKSVLEIGFATGLPSVYALENGAASVSVHATTASTETYYCKPTIQRNAVQKNKYKLSNGDLHQLKKSIGGKKFDVILAVDLLNRSQEEFEQLHEILDAALSETGVIFFSCSTHYVYTDGCLPSFLSLLKRHRQFDAHERWSSSRTDFVQRKVYQMTRSMF